MGKQTRYPKEVRERAVCLVFESQDEYESQWAALTSISAKIGCAAETPRKWVRQAEIDEGRRDGLSSDERKRMKELEKEVKELRTANEILRKASVYFAQAAIRPAERADRDFTATRPNQLWVADFTLDALNQALWARRVVDGLIHHSDRGSRYLSFRYSERLTEAGIAPSVGSEGDSYDNAMAETINGPYKAEAIHRRSSWQRIEQVELETLDWVDWYNNRRLMEPLGHISPAEYEASYF